MKIPVEVSARHAHLSQKDIEALFGAGYQLEKMKDLTQPSDFAAKETISIKTNSYILENLRIVGPAREETQIEISMTDAYALAINAPIRMSGDIAGTSGIKVSGPAGEIEISQGVIVAQRHLHCSLAEAEELGIKNGDEISVRINAGRPATLHNIKVRVKDSYKLCLHLDTDEGNACGINKTSIGEIIL